MATGRHAPASTGPDLERLLELAASQLSAQLQAQDSLDAKAGYLLAFNAVVVGLVFQAWSALGAPKWPLLAIAASAVGSVISMHVTNMLDGPDPGAFAQNYGSSCPIVGARLHVWATRQRDRANRDATAADAGPRR